MCGLRRSGANPCHPSSSWQGLTTLVNDWWRKNLMLGIPSSNFSPSSLYSAHSFLSAASKLTGLPVDSSVCFLPSASHTRKVSLKSSRIVALPTQVRLFGGNGHRSVAGGRQEALMAPSKRSYNVKPDTQMTGAEHPVVWVSLNTYHAVHRSQSNGEPSEPLRSLFVLAYPRGHRRSVAADRHPPQKASE